MAVVIKHPNDDNEFIDLPPPHESLKPPSHFETIIILTLPTSFDCNGQCLSCSPHYIDYIGIRFIRFLVLNAELHWVTDVTSLAAILSYYIVFGHTSVPFPALPNHVPHQPTPAKEYTTLHNFLFSAPVSCYCWCVGIETGDQPSEPDPVYVRSGQYCIVDETSH